MGLLPVLKLLLPPWMREKNNQNGEKSRERGKHL